MVEHTRYDLVFEIESRFYRVQCKWAPLKDGVVVANLATSRYKSNGEHVRSRYTTAEIDAVVVYCESLDRSYLLPPALFEGRRGVSLRVDHPLNGQRASLNWAADYAFPGAVAQLEVAPRWQRGGRGFESRQLHSSEEGASTVGANVPQPLRLVHGTRSRR